MAAKRYGNSGNSEGREDSPGLPASRYSDRRGGPPPYRGREPPAGRVYVGNLPNNADRGLIQDLFSKFGTILEISIKRTISGSPFAFVEFEDPRDAQDAIQDRDGYKIDGCALRVEIPFAARGGGGRPSNNTHNRGPPRRADYRVIIRGLPPSGSWQDLKDHMREAGDCVYTDVFRDGTGVVEFARREDMEYALRHLSDSRFVSHEGEQSRITVTRDVDDEYDRRSYERSRYRGRSPYGGRGYSGDHYGVSRHGGDRGHESRRHERVYSKNDGERLSERSSSRPRRSVSYSRKSRSRSRSYRGQY
ncbi:serine/arginine-rich splicing factor 9-like [Hylaeus volcanicus]|uniref:serine/arginine-rich splicing factor 9-like n=1 Tax=Hylaeus volcanicus TaxID=313075 RepID=UPI0023B7795D|nr:serine/arginine-rich splicing factor 9-like [Hylaeus volcanicus]